MTASDTIRFSGSLTARRDSRVGVVGLGHMGHAFAANLVADGYQVCVYDRDPKRAATVIGATAGARLGDLAACNVVLTSRPTTTRLLRPRSVQRVWHPFSNRGAFTFPRAPSVRGCLAASPKSMRSTAMAISQHRSSGTRILPGQGSSSYGLVTLSTKERCRPIALFRRQRDKAVTRTASLFVVKLRSEIRVHSHLEDRGLIGVLSASAG